MSILGLIQTKEMTIQTLNLWMDTWCDASLALLANAFTVYIFYAAYEHLKEGKHVQKKRLQKGHF
jgi:hypothetical protein